MFNALVLNQHDKQTTAEVKALTTDDLPEGEVLVRVAYSSLNFKDGLAVTGTGKIIRQFPMVPGIDFCGVVETSSDPRYQAGDEVVLTGWGVGENHWGGFSQYARVSADWLVPKPKDLSLSQTMAVGTAGLTAMLCVMALEDAGLKAGDEVVITGAAGGVGSVAIQLLSELGFKVSAVSGRAELTDYLLALGADEVIGRDAVSEPSRPLEKQRWKGAVDTVGGQILANVLAKIEYSGAVAACGLAADFKLPTTVMPFILRNVRLQGVDSVSCPFERRTQAWQRLAQLLPESFFALASETIALEQVPEYAEKIVQGQVKGRVLVSL